MNINMSMNRETHETNITVENEYENVMSDVSTVSVSVSVSVSVHVPVSVQVKELEMLHIQVISEII